MSFTRSHDDECQYFQELKQNQGVLTHIMDPNKYYNCNPCRVEFGIVGGNNVSLNTGNLVDRESELRLQTRQFGLCSNMKYQPGVANGTCGTDGLPFGSMSCHKEDLKHLPACTMINYKARHTSKGYEIKYPSCQSHATFAHGAKKVVDQKKHKNIPGAWQGQQGLANY
jgi:hypothetical protein